MAPILTGIDLTDETATWKALGFDVADGRVQVGQVTLNLGCPAVPRPGLVGWHFDGLATGDTDDIDDIDGIPTGAAPSRTASPQPNGVNLIDHVVLVSRDIGRTTGALEAHGLGVRRMREVDEAQYGFPAQQVFFRAGEVILELIGPETPDPERAGDPARLYGLAFTADDLDALVDALGPALGRVKDAVQPGRRIVTARRGETGSAVAIAFMSGGAAAV